MAGGLPQNLAGEFNVPAESEFSNMNWDQIAGQWKQLKGAVKEKFGKLTDDDLNQIAGRREQFVGKIQERYGIAREEAQKRVDEWLNAHATEAQHAGRGPSSMNR